MQGFQAHLLRLGQHGGAFSDADSGDARLLVDTLHSGGDDLAQLALEFDQADALFTGAYSLTDNVARRGDRDPAQSLGVERHLDLVADLVFLSLVDLCRFLGRHLKIGVEHVVGNGLDELYIQCVLVGVSLENNVFVAAVVAFAGDLDRLLYLLQHVVHRNVLFLFEHTQRFKQFLVIHFSNHSFRVNTESYFLVFVYQSKSSSLIQAASFLLKVSSFSPAWSWIVTSPSA